MNGKTIVSALLLSAASVLTAETINNNSGMELGVIDGPVPGVKFESFTVNREVLRKNPERLYYPRTVKDGKNGRCMMIPGYKGAANYRFSFEDFYIPDACEVEISFDVKAAPNEDGSYTPDQQFVIDFRANTDYSRDKYYPMLTGMAFRPSDKWQHVSKRFKITGYTNFYSIWILPRNNGKPINTLYIDNFRFVRSGAPAKPQNEYAVTFSKVDSTYRAGEEVGMTFRAILDSSAETVPGNVLVRFFHDGKRVAVLPVELKRQADGVYEGKAVWKPSVCGAFAASLELNGFTAQRIGGDFAVIHEPVSHPRFSPGWGIGTNVPSDSAFRDANFENNAFLTIVGGYDRTFRDMRLIGIRTGRVWGHWRAVEPERGRFRADLLNDQLVMLRKYQVEPVFCLVGSFVTKADIRQVLKRGAHGFPAYLAEWHKVTKDNRDGVLMVPMEGVYSKYLDFVFNTWKNDVKIWELSNEPGLLIRPPDGHAKWFIGFCKYTYERIKKAQPDSIILGNGVTGDFGMNMVGWCKQLNEADPDYVNWLDGVAFHPYNCGLDYMNGMYFRYRDVIRDISAQLKVKKPLWNTEDFYLQTAYSKQIDYYLNKERYGANEIARMYLDSMVNGLKASLAPSYTSFYRQVNVNGLAAPNDVFAATNALSALLNGMDRVEEVSVSNWVRAGLFTSRDGKKALGFLYDMRPSGSRWIPGKAAVQVHDIYANPVKEKEYRLRFEPYYLTGTPSEVRKALKNSEFKLENPVGLYGRRFEDTVYFEGKNLTGLPIEIESQIGGVPVMFSFRFDPVRDTVAIPGFKGKTDNAVMIPDTPGYRLPVRLTMEKGSTVEIARKGAALMVTVNVKEASPKAGSVFHQGSCVELFADAEPFRRMELNAIFPRQFYATPEGRSGELKKGKVQPEGGFSCRTGKSADGWNAVFELPLSAFGEIAGIDVSVGRADGSKERLKGISGSSFMNRYHFPLFRIRELPDVKNGGFEQNSYGSPDIWGTAVQNGMMYECGPQYGIRGNGMKIAVSKPCSIPAAVSQTVRFPAGKWSKAYLSFMAKLENVKALNAKDDGRGGLMIRAGMKRSGYDYTAQMLRRNVTGTSGWKLWRIPILLRNGTDFLEVSIGLAPRTTGTVLLDDVSLTFEP